MATRKLNSRHLLTGFALTLAVITTTGCQIVENGQTLPSPYYLHDDVQYFPPGPEFILTNEAAAQKAYRAEEEARRR